MNILLKTRFGKAIIEKLIEKSARDHLGCELKASLNELNITHKDGEPIVVHLDIYAKMDEAQIKKLLEGLKVI